MKVTFTLDSQFDDDGTFETVAEFEGIKKVYKTKLGTGGKQLSLNTVSVHSRMDYEETLMLRQLCDICRDIVFTIRYKHWDESNKINEIESVDVRGRAAEIYYALKRDYELHKEFDKIVDENKWK